MNLADELWIKFRTVVKGIHFDETYMGKAGFEAALREYGEAVRKRDVEVCIGKQTVHPSAENFMAIKCAAAVKDEPLP